MDTIMKKKEFFCNRKRNRKKNDNIENYNHRDVNESINLNNVFNLEDKGK